MKLPIVGNPAIDNENQDHENKKSPMFRVLRSKGFMWVSTKHDEPLFWSQAGRFFELKDFGKFWASTDLRWWPDDELSLRDIARDFGGPDNKWGDRRQEIVFIGPEIDRAGIEAMLDDCLLTEGEWFMLCEAILILRTEEFKKYVEEEVKRPDLVRLDFTQDPPVPIANVPETAGIRLESNQHDAPALINRSWKAVRQPGCVLHGVEMMDRVDVVDVVDVVDARSSYVCDLRERFSA
eukprot:768153-Hanusia_phi.AAC.5